MSVVTEYVRELECVLTLYQPALFEELIQLVSLAFGDQGVSLPTRSAGKMVLKTCWFIGDVLMFEKWGLVALVVNELKDVS